MGEDENLEIVFWWAGEESATADSDIEDDLDAFLPITDKPNGRRRRRPWPGRRDRTA